MFPLMLLSAVWKGARMAFSRGPLYVEEVQQVDAYVIPATKLRRYGRFGLALSLLWMVSLLVMPTQNGHLPGAITFALLLGTLSGAGFATLAGCMWIMNRPNLRPTNYSYRRLK